MNGTIVSANYDAIYTKEYVAEGENANAQYFKVDGDKATALSKDQIGDGYGMKAAGSALEWYEQAALFWKDYVVANQTIFPVNADGYARMASLVSPSMQSGSTVSSIRRSASNSNSTTIGQEGMA